MLFRSLAVSLAEAVVLVLLLLDRVLEIGWPDPLLTPMKGLAIVAAVVVAALPFQSWSVTEPRSQPLNIAVVAGLVGGAAVTASVFDATDGRLFGSLTMTLLGIAGIVVTAVTLRVDARARGPRP